MVRQRRDNRFGDYSHSYLFKIPVISVVFYSARGSTTDELIQQHRNADDGRSIERWYYLTIKKLSRASKRSSHANLGQNLVVAIAAQPFFCFLQFFSPPLPIGLVPG